MSVDLLCADSCQMRVSQHYTLLNVFHLQPDQKARAPKEIARVGRYCRIIYAGDFLRSLPLLMTVLRSPTGKLMGMSTEAKSMTNNSHQPHAVVTKAHAPAAYVRVSYHFPFLSQFFIMYLPLGVSLRMQHYLHSQQRVPNMLR